MCAISTLQIYVLLIFFTQCLVCDIISLPGGGSVGELLHSARIAGRVVLAGAPGSVRDRKVSGAVENFHDSGSEMVFSPRKVITRG